MSSREKPENLEADLVILGSGGGLAAAVTAAEGGVKDIIVLEKQGVLGGNTRLANGFFACESPVQKRANIVTDRDEYFKIAMKWAHCARVDPRVVRAYVNASGDTVRWLEEEGVKFAELSSQPGRPRGGHMPVGGGEALQKVLVKKCEELGVKTLLHTSGQRILRGANGVTGVVAANREGKEFEIKARSVIIATGGFPGNRELLKKYCPDFSDDMQLGKWPYHTGDGLLMAAEVGAAIAESIPIFHVGPVPEAGSWGGLSNAVKEPITVWVNKRGKRYIDEAGHSVWENGNAIRMQPDMATYTIFDDTIRQKLEEKGLLTARGWGKTPWAEESASPETGETFRALADKGLLRIFNSWDDMASWIGADPAVLKATIDEYNAACDQGRDPIFAKNRGCLLPLRKAPYYAVRCYVSCGETMGGIKVTGHLEVLDTQENIIPGLYAASVLADGWSGQTYPADEMGGSAFGFAVNSGRIAGESAARYILGK